jgi:hypothetical protein
MNSHQTDELNKYLLFIIYKPYASNNFSLNQYNEFGRDSIVFSSIIVFIYMPVAGLKAGEGVDFFI